VNLCQQELEVNLITIYLIKSTNIFFISKMLIIVMSLRIRQF